MRPARIAGLIACLTTPSLALAQVDAAFPNVSRFGVIGSVNLATLSGSNAQGVDNRTGFMGGVVVSLPIAQDFAIQPEAVFTMKGASSSASGFSAAAKLNYIEIPVLLRYDVPAVGSVKPFLYTGPSVALKLSCDIEGSGGGTSVSISCSDFQRQFGGLGTISAYDAGAVFGGGLAFNVGGRVLSLGARYELGFVDITSSTDSKNRVLSFVGAFEWPFHR